MKKKWETGRDWDKSRTEKVFEKLLCDNGYTVKGVRLYISKTDYLIEKDGIQQEFSVHGVDNSGKRGELCYTYFNDMFEMKVKLAKAIGTKQ